MKGLHCVLLGLIVQKAGMSKVHDVKNEFRVVLISY